MHLRQYAIILRMPEGSLIRSRQVLLPDRIGLGAHWMKADSVRRGALTFLVALLLLIPTSIATLSSSGFCFRQGRFLSDTEYIDAAIARENSLKSQVIREARPSTINFRSVPAVPYESVSEFRRQNPACCALVPHNLGDDAPYVSLFEQLVGDAAKTVSLTYTMNYRGDDGRQQSVVVTTKYLVTACGHAWNARY